MKILIVCQHYYPDPFRITDVAENFVKQGHEVFVLAGEPSYERELWLKEGGKVDEVRNGVKVHRVKTVPRGKGVIRRVRNYYSYAINSKRYVKKLDKDFDVVFVYELSPIMMAEAAIKYKKKYGTKIVLYCLDLWPKSLTAGGIKEGGFIYNHYKKLSKKIYAAADELLVTSESFKVYFASEFGFDKEKITYLPQYAESVYLPETCKKTTDENIDLMFAGNIGAAQSVETILEAADMLKGVKNLRFHIVGDGTRLENCKRIAETQGLTNVKFYGHLPLEEMPRMYSKADAMMVTGDNGVVSQTLPAKVQGYMAACKPIIGAIGGETARVIEQANCGFCGEALNAEQLKENILKFISTENKEVLGLNGYNFYEKNFRPQKFFKNLNESLTKCKKERILLLSPLPPPEGGIAMWTKKYLTYCQRNNIDLKIVNTALIGSRGKKINSKRNIRDEIYRTSIILREFKRCLKIFKPEIVHINTSCSKFGIIRDWLCSCFAKKRGVSIVLQCHCNIADQVKSNVGHFFLKKIVTKVDKIIVLNSSSQNYVKESCGVVSEVIPNFVEDNFLKDDYTVNDAISNIVFVGHVQKSKGCFDIFKVAEKFPQYKFKLVGPIASEIENTHIPSNVILIGTQRYESVMETLRFADVFLFLSHTEGFSMALLEAMAVGLPCVATDVGANLDMLENKGGVIVPLSSIDNVVLALESMKSRNVRERMSQWNREKVRNFYLQNTVLSKIIQIYSDLLDKD